MARWSTKKLSPEERDAMLRERILSCAKTPEECWLWDGATNCGYATLGNRRMSRQAYRLFVGPLVDGISICHRCDNPSCINPAHLFSGTQSANMRDASRKGRLSQKLTIPDVRSIRAFIAMGVRLADLARAYQVHRSLILQIKKRTSWEAI